MLNVKVRYGSHASFDKLMFGKFFRSQLTLQRFHLETETLVHSTARDSILENSPSNTLNRPSENFGAN